MPAGDIIGKESKKGKKFKIERPDCLFRFIIIVIWIYLAAVLSPVSQLLYFQAVQILWLVYPLFGDYLSKYRLVSIDLLFEAHWQK